MSILLGDNFKYEAAKPLDGRLKYDTLATMKAVTDATMYEGCLAYCVETDKTYQWKSTNTVDADLGKWRELSGGGHAIEDSEGTALTQRDTMQFGDGFNATDDSENEKTVVEPNFMTAADMDDVVTPLPSVQSRYHKYSTEEQIVGEWIDGKPLYEKTVVIDSPKRNTYEDVAQNVDNGFIVSGYILLTNGFAYSGSIYNSSSDYLFISCRNKNNVLSIAPHTTASMSKVYATVRYTKVTT